MDAWLTREVEKQAAAGQSLPRLLSATEDWLLWRQCAAEATGGLDLVNRGALADSLRRASVLAAEYRIDLHRLSDGPGTETELLYQVQRAVESRYRQLNAAPLAEVIPNLGCVGDDRPVRFSGFLTLSARLQEIISARTSLGYASRRAKDGAAVAQAQSHPEVVIAADEWAELERIAAWCRMQIDRHPEGRILVVLPGAAGPRERLATLIRQTVDPRSWLGDSSPAAVENRARDSLVVIEGGSPLASIPAVAHALSTLQWLSGSAGEFETVSEWLRAPFWKVPQATARAQLDLWLRERGHMQLDLQQLAAMLRAVQVPALMSAANEIAAQIETAALALAKGPASPRDWSQRFGEALAALGWPGGRTQTSADHQTIARFHELLDEFGQLASAATSLSRGSAIQWFTELAGHINFQPADADGVITISSRLADPVVIYDGIWVAGLHSEALPQPVQPDPFLPLAAQIQAGIPAASAGGRLAEARQLMSAWRSATPQLVLSAPARSQDLDLLPSPLLAQWLAGKAAAAPETDAAVWLPLRLRRDGLIESVEDFVGLGWPVQRPMPAGSRSLELQNLCPFRAYAELRLGSLELDRPEPGVAPDIRGQILHAALQIFWQRVGNSSTLSDFGDPALLTLIEECVAEAANRTVGASHGGRSPSLLRECRRATRLIRDLCELEKKRAPFRVTDTELSTVLKVAGAHMNLRIDRVDALESGGRAILDYKSGQRATADWYGERPSHPQLLAYLAALGEDVVAMATVNVTAKEVRFDGIADSAKLLPRVKGVQGPDGADGADAWSVRRREWLGRVEHLAAGFVAGVAAVDPKPGACDYCHVRSVCRIADQAEVDAEATAGDGE